MAFSNLCSNIPVPVYIVSSVWVFLFCLRLFSIFFHIRRWMWTSLTRTECRPCTRPWPTVTSRWPGSCSTDRTSTSMPKTRNRKFIILSAQQSVIFLELKVTWMHCNKMLSNIYITFNHLCAAVPPSSPPLPLSVGILMSSHLEWEGQNQWLQRLSFI